MFFFYIFDIYSVKVIPGAQKGGKDAYIPLKTY